MSLVRQEVYDATSSMWVEIFFLSCFAVAFLMLRLTAGKYGKTLKKVSHHFKAVHADASTGKSADAIRTWRSMQVQEATPCDTLKVVTQAFLDAEPASLTSEIINHMTTHRQKIGDSRSAAAVLEVVAQHGTEEIMEDLYRGLSRQLRISATSRMYEIMLGGHANAGNEEKVRKLISQVRDRRQRVTFHGYSLVVRGFLKNGMLDAALSQIQDMNSQKFILPPYAVSEVFRVAHGQGRTVEVYQRLLEQVNMTADAVFLVTEQVFASQDVVLAKDIEKLARDSKVQMTFATCENLVKLYTSAGDSHAPELFDEMQKRFPFLSDGLCASLIARCAEPKFLRMAEDVVAFIRSRSKMTIVFYSALMKVYSYCNLHSKACDLYEQICADGLEPDSVMYGCLMKFSAACGRTDLTRELSSKVKGCDIQHYMALIRAAGQDKDVSKAFAVLEQARASGFQLDTVVYNAVLDVCSSAGDMVRARTLVDDMQKMSVVDIVSYNTLLKGHCMQNNLHSAKKVMSEMQAAGFPPNDISYNCLINMAASSGNFQAAWETIEMMEHRGVQIDHYTVSIMMKALKNTRSSRDAVNRVMSLLDRHGIDVYGEEVLLNTAVEACIKHGEHRRLDSLLSRFDSKSTRLRLALHTYATFIRAFGILKRPARCRDLWTEMTEMRNLQPNDVALGCMLEALVSNGGVVEGVSLLRKWQDKINVNTVLYSTLIKGFTNTRDLKGAREMWQELRTKKLPLNNVVYNVIIDANARAGDMDEVSELVKNMEDEGYVPDDITLSMIAKGYCVTGDLDKALDVFKKLPSEPNPNVVVVFNTILDGCVRHHRNDLADLLLNNMEAWGIHPTNVTLGTIVKMWGRRRQVNKALAAVKMMPQKYGFAPNGPVHTCLLFACLRNDALDAALKVYDDIRIAGFNRDGKMLSALISNCARSGKFEEAISLCKEAYGLDGRRRVMPAGEDLDKASLEQLLKALSRHGLMDKLGSPLVNALRGAKVPVSPRLLSLSLQMK